MVDIHLTRGGHSNWSCTQICDRGQNGQDTNKGMVTRGLLVTTGQRGKIGAVNGQGPILAGQNS